MRNQTSDETILALLRNACVRLYECESQAMDCFLHFSHSLADDGKRFRVQKVILRYFKPAEVVESLPLMQRIGAKQFDVRVFFERGLLMLLGNEILRQADYLHLRAAVRVSVILGPL